MSAPPVHTPQLSRRAFSLGCLALLLAGCQDQPAQEVGEPQAHAWADASQAHVAATFYPMYDFASKVAGEAAEVVCLVPAGTEPHGWEPTPGDVATIQSADLLVMNGLGADSWAERVLESLGDDAPEVVVASDGVSARTDDGGATDPHAWLDPRAASTQAANIAGALARIDPDNGTAYHTNMARLVSDLNDLTQEYATRLTTLPNHEIVVSHEAYGYLCDAFGLTQVGIEGLSPDSEPDAARMAEIVDLVRGHGVTTVFFEELVSPKVAQAIADETGAEAVELSPLEGLTDAQLSAGEDYLSVMRENLDKLERALS